MGIPEAVEATTNISRAELEILREEFDKEAPLPSAGTTFNYAWGLVRSANPSNHSKGLNLLSSLYQSEPDRRRECLYYLALAHFKLGEYAEARREVETLLELEPGNSQARSLHALIMNQVEKDGFIGMAIVGGAVALASAAVLAIFGGGRRGH